MTNYRDKGAEFSTKLTLIFITLKLIGKISWSWWWILAPTWVPAVLVTTILGSAFLLSLVLTSIGSNRRTK